MAVFATCIYYLVKSKSFSWLYQIYIAVLFILASTNIACNIRFSELSWVDERNFPGGVFFPHLYVERARLKSSVSQGPGAFIELEDNLPVHIIGDAAANAVTLMVDSLLVSTL